MLPAASAASLLTAGEVDDHLNWSHFLKYSARAADPNATSTLPPVDLADRLTLRVLGDGGRPVPFAQIEISPIEGAAVPVRLVAGSDGIVRLFPRHDVLGSAEKLEVRVHLPGASAVAANQAIDLSLIPADRTVTLTVPGSSALPTSVDIMFVIDTTGSMGDELNYITEELESIVSQVVAAQNGLDIRFGLTVYRDQGDAYVVRNLGFTTDLQTMLSSLGLQESDGGGDYPEAMDQALAAAVHEQWRGGSTARILFLVADAPPHPAGYAPFLAAAAEARLAGIHVYPLAASGVAAEAEYLMRQAAALTQGRYLFLTDDSGIGNSHAEPKIACYLVMKLDHLLARIVESEVTGKRVEPREEDVIRKVGNYERGVCLEDPQDQQQVPGDQGSEAPKEASATPAYPGDSDSLYLRDATRGRSETLVDDSAELRYVAETGGDGDGRLVGAPASDGGPPKTPAASFGLAVLAALAAVGLAWRAKGGGRSGP